jgi:hypothetical protein
MLSYGSLSELATTLQKERWEEARRARLVAEVRAGRPRLRDRSLSRVGSVMILFGQKLKERYEPRVQLRPVRGRHLPERAPGD